MKATLKSRLTVSPRGRCSCYIPLEIIDAFRWKGEDEVRMVASGRYEFILAKETQQGETLKLRNAPKVTRSIQVTIPTEISRFLDIHKGDVVEWIVLPGKRVRAMIRPPAPSGTEAEE